MWCWEKKTRAGWLLNTFAIKLTTGNVAVFSPTARLGDRAHQELQETVGQPEFLLASNHYHNLGLPEWHERYPDAGVIAAPLAAGRVAKKTKLEIGDLTALVERLPTHVELVEPVGTKHGEVWFDIQCGDDQRLWVVSDAWFNAGKVSGGFGLMLRALRIVPGLRIGTTWTQFVLKDKAAYRQWVLERLAERPPTRLAMCHGTLIEGADTAARLIEVAERRL